MRQTDNRRKISFNFIFGVLAQALSLLLGVIVPRFVLTSYGSAVNGLISSVTQIYSYFSLLEAGIGFATTQALYKTFSEKDEAATNAVLAATNRNYHKTGLIYLLLIGLFSAVYPLIVDTGLPTLTVVLIIVLNGLGSVISFFFQGKYFLLLQADGKGYIQNGLNMATNVFKNVSKIVLMRAGMDVVFVQAAAMAVSLIQMAYVTVYIKVKYKWIDLSVRPNYGAISQSRNVLVHQIGGLVFNNTDMIVLSIACSVELTSVYSMYALLFTVIANVVSVVFQSVSFALGQLFHSDFEKYKRMRQMFETYFMALVFAMFTVTYYFVLPFMRLYTAGVNDINYIDERLPILFCLMYLLSNARTVCNSDINFAGHFKQTQWRSIAESAINVIVSIVLVIPFGIYGVLLGSIAALLYRTNDVIIYSSRKILCRSPWKTYRLWIADLALFAAAAFLRRFFAPDLSSYLKIVAWCVPVCAANAAAFFTVNSLIDIESSHALAEHAKKFLFRAVKKSKSP